VNRILLGEKVSSGYGRVVVVHEVTLEVRKGEIVALLGPNGSGKSTLLKTFFGLLPIKSGQVFFDNMDISNLKPYQLVEKGMSYVPQVDNIFPSLTVKENLEMGGYLLKNPSEKIQEMFRLFPILEERQKEAAITLSGGERQMLSLARALMLDPKLLLLDEPSAGLAPMMIKTIMEQIQKIRETGVSILLVEQNAKSALKIADRGYILAGGRKVFEGTADEIINHPEIGKIYFGRK
jgi:ABC-type branched-subunit amino acid transport system ATPase component